MGEPLKKEHRIDIRIELDNVAPEDDAYVEDEGYARSRVKSAVEWLKDAIKPLSNTKIDRYRVIETIDQAFPDLQNHHKSNSIGGQQPMPKELEKQFGNIITR